MTAANVTHGGPGATGAAGPAGPAPAAHRPRPAPAPASRLFPMAFGASVIGSGHRLTGACCQDAFALSCDTGLPGFGVIAVADGLGSAPHSELGAWEAARTAVALASSRLRAGAAPDALTDVSRDAVAAARDAVVSGAADLGVPARELACTLLVAVFLGTDLAVAHVGDGAVVGEVGGGGELRVISPPAASEHVNEVLPLTSRDWAAGLAVRACADVRAAAVFTDGCQVGSLRRTPAAYAAHAPFFRPLFRYARGAADPRAAAADVRDLLAGDKFARDSDDDKTLVVAVLGGHGSGAGDRAGEVAGGSEE